MSRAPDYVRKKYGPLQEKTLQNALAHTIAEQFPRIGGPRIRELCAEMLLEVVGAHVRPREHVRHGQVLWMGVATDHPPRYRQRLTEAKLVPVVLDLSTPEDIEGRIDRKPSMERLQTKAVRLCQEAHQQGALLSNCDLAELLGANDSRVAQALTTFEEKTKKLVPRRATLHDVGTGLTHKRIICWKRYAQGKSPDIVAQETYHSLEAVDRYLGQFDRVRHCHQQGMTVEETAFTLNGSRSLVKEYLAIDRELKGPGDG